MHEYEYPRPSVTVDTVVFGYNSAHRYYVLLIERRDEPFKGQLALPGGYLNVRDDDDGDQGEGLENGAFRELEEETGLRPGRLEQLGAFGAPGRDPRGRVITVVFIAVVDMDHHKPKAGDDAKSVKWVPVYHAKRMRLAFDHNLILNKALDRFTMV
jgi:8-oxo-dGTP diphosphatase